MSEPSYSIPSIRAGALERLLNSRRAFAAIAVVLLVLVAVGANWWLAGATAEDLASLGYAGVFLVMVASGASTFFPLPGQLSVLASGAVWNPVLVGIAAGLGNATGETIAFLVCKAATVAVRRITDSGLARVLNRWFERNGFLTILAIAVIPNPIFDAVGMVAAVARYPMPRFWIACALGNTVKYIAMAHFGRAAGSFFTIPF